MASPGPADVLPCPNKSSFARSSKATSTGASRPPDYSRGAPTTPWSRGEWKRVHTHCIGPNNPIAWPTSAPAARDLKSRPGACALVGRQARRCLFAARPAPWALLFDFSGLRSVAGALQIALAAAASAAFLVGIVGSGFCGCGRVWQHAVVLLSVCALACIPLYFEVRRSQRPNKMEIALAFIWILIRRLVLITFALPLAFYSISAFRSGNFGAAILTLLFACVLAWWGWVGAGYRRAFEDDLPMHNARRRRYGWK
jgi:hypothetical protein